MRKPNPNLYVPIEFIDLEGVTHRSDNWGDLIAHVRDYRARSKRPPGDPEKEIFEQVCSKYPRNCRPSKAPVKETQGNISARMINWLSKVLKMSVRFVSSQEASRRAAICRGCPEQTAWRRSGGCSTCKAIDKLATRAAEGRRLNDLVGCGALGEDCRVSVYIEQPGVDNVPAHCWRKKK